MNGGRGGSTGRCRMVFWKEKLRHATRAPVRLVTVCDTTVGMVLARVVVVQITDAFHALILVGCQRHARHFFETIFFIVT